MGRPARSHLLLTPPPLPSHVRDPRRITYRWSKRGLDLVLSTVALIFLSPIILCLIVLVRARLGTPALFRQERAGLKGRPFTLVKLRTMTEARNAQGSLLPDAERLTDFGRFLRSSSLDELPQLWNVFKGEMSLVGPRPLYLKYVDLYSSEQRRRLEVPPGLTGLAQVNGRNALSWEDKLGLDVQYVNNAGMGLDLQILITTFGRVVRRKDINQDGQATVCEFTGSATSKKEPS